MGCVESKGGVVHGPGEGGSGGSGPGPAQGGMAISIPTIPGWDGVPMSTMPIQVEFLMKGSWGSIKTSMDPLTNTIIAPNTAGAGYKFAAVFLPVNHVEGKKKGQPLDGAPSGFMSFKGRAMCIFQKDHHNPDGPLETLFLKAPMTVTAVMSFTSPTEVSGYQGLYSQLGQAGQQGFPLSSVIDEPNLRCSGLFSAETSVHLICQRPQGIQPPPSQYLVANCPIQTTIAGFSRQQKASMPNLINILSSYTTQGYKISSVYNPPTVSLTGWNKTESQCHIVLAKTPINYHFTVCDVPFTVKLSWSSNVDHNQYLAYIQAYAAQGWELAGLIDLPDTSIEGFTSISSTIKLIFQAPALGGGAGGYVSIYSVDVMVPEGAGPGSSVQVQHPTTGVISNAVVPVGVPPGGVFKVQFG